MKPNTLSVMISGCAGTGKSTIMQVIVDALTEKGITVKVIDDNDVIMRDSETLERCIKEVRKFGSVRVTTIQLRRVSTDGCAVFPKSHGIPAFVKFRPGTVPGP